MKTICTFRIPLNNIGGHKIIKEKLPFLLIFMQNSWENVDDHFSSVIIHNIMLLYSICTKKLAQKHRFFPFFEKVPPWLILWLFVQLKNAWGPKLCVSLALRGHSQMTLQQWTTNGNLKSWQKLTSRDQGSSGKMMNDEKSNNSRESIQNRH